MKTSLEILLENLNLTEEQKSELYRNLRSLNIHDDNDPLIKITLILSIIAKFIGEVPERMAYERQFIENVLKDQKEVTQKLSTEIGSFKEKIPTSIAQNAKPQKLLNNKQTKHSWECVVIFVLLTLIGLIFNYCYSFNSIEKTYTARKEFLEKCSKTPEIFKVTGKNGWFLTIEPDSITNLQNGQTAAQIKGYY